MQQYSSGTLSKATVDGFKSTMWQTYSHNISCSLPYKAIVFSQFLEHINVIEQQVRHPEDSRSILSYPVGDGDGDGATSLLLRRWSRPSIIDGSSKNVDFSAQ